MSDQTAPQRLSVPRWQPTPSLQITPEQRATLHRVADQLIPANDENPAGSQAEGYDLWLDRCIAARRDATDELVSTLDSLGNCADLDGALRDLHVMDPNGAFHLVSSIVAGAYLAGPDVRERIGYPGQFRDVARFDEAANELADGILDPVIERGYIYTPTETEPASTGGS
jgi:hypothetical protein